MITYELHLESGPKRKKTMVHVLDLLGCVATGPTTDAALAATPAAIGAYRAFLHRIGEPIDPDAPFGTVVAEHITEGDWLGNGSPYITFARDLTPIDGEEIERYLGRFAGIRETLADWAATRSDAALDAAPDVKGRTARAILLHVLGATGAYISAGLQGAKGFSALHGAAERGEIRLDEALRRMSGMAAERIRGTTDEERAHVRELTSRTYTLRKAMRRMLEHDWEHLAELSRRPGGPDV